MRKITKTFKKTAAFVLALIISLSTLVCSACTIVNVSGDYDVVNAVQTEGYITATFKIVATVTQSTQKAQYVGSGVAYKVTESENEMLEYYVLTNNHVVVPQENVSYEIFDCFGAKTGIIAENKKDVFGFVTTSEKNTVRLLGAEASYDLAVLSFKVHKKGNSGDKLTDNDYKTLPFSATNPKIGDKVIAIGNPFSVFNSVTVGAVKEYAEVSVDDDKTSEVKFPVISHNAPINHGSSGGALLNSSYQIAGINFACGLDKVTGKFSAGYAVSVKKVIEFLILKGLYEQTSD